MGQYEYIYLSPKCVSTTLFTVGQQVEKKTYYRVYRHVSQRVITVAKQL